MTQRKPDIDRAALEDLLGRVFGSKVPASFERTPDGVSTQVYRIARGREVYYLRLGEDPEDDLSVDAELHRELIRRGVRAPDVVYVEPFDRAIGRSLMVTAGIPGAPLAQAASLEVAARVAREAGEQMALMGQIDVAGFGFLRRERPEWPPRAEFAAYADFVTSYLPTHWPGALASLFDREELLRIEATIAGEKGRSLERGTLAHGDLDTTHIYHEGGSLTGIIDFGEARGAEPTFDLGHLLHDREQLPWALAEQVLAGYRDVVNVPADFPAQVRCSAILLGLRQLCRWIGPARRVPRDHPAVKQRVLRLKELLAPAEAGRTISG